MKERKIVRVAPHASQRGATSLIVFGAVLVVVGSLLGLLGLAYAAITGVAAGVAIIGLGVWKRRIGWGAQLCNTASGAVATGRFAEAEALLAEVEASRPGGYLRRFVELQRAVIAMRRGNLEEAAARTGVAMAIPIGLRRVSAGAHAAEVRAVHALASAALGRIDVARAAIAAVRDDPHAASHAVARAELAEAMLLERAGERAALREHLRRERFVLLENTTPRERSVVRAYQQMVRVQTTTPYREPAAAAGERRIEEEPALGDWVALVAPAAARFVRVKPQAAAGAPLQLPHVDEATRAARQKGLPSGRATARRTLVLWVVLVAAFIGIWQLFSPERAGEAPVVHPGPLESSPTTAAVMAVTAVPAVMFAVFAAVLTAIFVASRRGQRRMTEAQALVARGHLEAAALACRQLLRSWLPLIAGHGAMWLSELLARDGEWEECLAVADRAIARLRAADATRVAASDLLLPALHARRASALQALGRVHEAHAELALLYEQFPAFPGLPVTHHRVALFRAARRGDLAEVARLADLAGDDLGISVREELLADVARAVCRTGATSAAEVERLRAELRDDPASQRWLVKVCPSLLSGFEVTYGDADGTTSQCSGAVDPGGDEVEAAHEGERELRAELEATEATVPRRARG